MSQADYWNEFYQQHLAEIPQPQSGFTGWVSSRVKLQNCLLFDWGAGSGRDSIYLASMPIRVIALDQSLQAVGAISAYAERTGTQNLTAIQYDITSEIIPPELLHTEKVVHYSRFFLHAIDDETLYTYFKLLREIGKPGDEILAEYRAETDRQIEYSWGGHARWLRDPKAVNSLASDFGFQLISEETGFGLAVYKSEDPFIARIHWVL